VVLGLQCLPYVSSSGLQLVGEILCTFIQSVNTARNLQPLAVCDCVFVCVISNLPIFFIQLTLELRPKFNLFLFVGISMQLIINSWGNSAYIYAIRQHSQGPTAPGCMCGYVHTCYIWFNYYSIHYTNLQLTLELRPKFNTFTQSINRARDVLYVV
jgi:hypothetical protein